MALSTIQLACELSKPYRFDKVQTLVETGLATNGRFMFKLPPDISEKVVRHCEKRNQNKGNRVVPVDALKSAMGVRLDLKSANIHSEQGGTEDVTRQYTLSSGIESCLVNADHFDTIRKYYPLATVMIGKSPPVFFIENGVVVGVLQPLAID